MQIGDIYNFLNNRIRIMMFDSVEVFYQTINEDGTFVYASSRTLIYYRTPKDYFDKIAVFIKHLALTKRETDIHRPDLPLRLNCFSGLFWTDKPFEKETDFIGFFRAKEINTELFDGLNCPAFAVFPTSQQQSHKKSVLLENSNGYFLGKDLMFQCFRIQSEYVNPEKPYFSRYRLIPEGREEKRLSGIGIYRLGIKNNLPSYYLGGEISMGELESEKRWIVE